MQVASCEAAVRAAVAELGGVVNSAGSSAGDALDPITFRLHAQEVRPLLEIHGSPWLCYSF